MTTADEVMQVTVNEMIARHPETVAVFNLFEIDTCCGGAVSIRAAAERDGADLVALERVLLAEIGCGA